MQSGSAFGSGAVRCVTPHPPPPLSPPPCLCAGRREAAQLAAELAPHMAAQDATLRALGGSELLHAAGAGAACRGTGHHAGRHPHELDLAKHRGSEHLWGWGE